MSYRLSSLAEQDLEEIWFHVAGDAGPTTADRLIDAIFERLELLVEQPRMGRSRPEFGEGIRSFVVENYVIYYRHDGDLLIARVLHGRRDQAAAWSQSLALINPVAFRRNGDLSALFPDLLRCVFGFC